MNIEATIAFIRTSGNEPVLRRQGVRDDEGKWQATGEPCQFKQVMAAVVFGLDVLDPGLNQQWMDRLQTKHKINPKQDGAVLRFLAKYYAMGRLQASNLFWEFDWITERLKTELL